MFNSEITRSARFLKMPKEVQCTYFHLCMHADDDGVVEAYTVMQMLGAEEDILRILTGKGFVKPLNEDLVTYIMDWNEHNLIRADRKRTSIYKDLLLQIIPDVDIKEARIRADVAKRNQLKSGESEDVDVQWTTNGQHSIGEVSKSKDSKEKPEKVVIELPDWLDKEKWQEWISYRKQRKLTCTEITMKKQLKLLGENQSTHVAIIEKSITNGWQGLFPEKGNTFSKNSAPANVLKDAHTQELIDHAKKNKIKLT